MARRHHVSLRMLRKSLSLQCLCKTSIILIVVSILILYFFNLFLPLPSLSSSAKYFENHDSRICKIPNIPLRSAAYNENVIASPVPHISRCDENPVMLAHFLDNGTLKFLRNDLYRRQECTAYEILRPPVLHSDRHELRKLESFDVTNQIHSITSEYVMVACGENTLRYSYHRRVLQNKEPILSRVRHWAKANAQLPLNVMVLVLDSTSAMDAFRQLPKTMDFLLSQLNFVKFRKFHAQGEPTMVNAMPLLTRNSAQAIFNQRSWMDQWDDVNFIWKIFQKAHYVTAYMEDLPFLGTFNYGLQTGFLYAPTDIYPRPLFTAWELNKKEKRKCIGDSSLWKFLLDYEFEILESLAGVAPSFTMPWLAWPFHEHFGTLAMVDDDMLDFFRSLSASPSILENTFIIIMADHGFYSSAYSSTHEGLLERRLPLFLLRIPEKLNQQIPNVSKIIMANAEQVTSHYDVYQTLAHVSKLTSTAHEDDKVSDPRLGQSLLQPINKGRTCREAGIPKTWCACNLPPPSPETVIPETVLLNVQPFHLARIREFIG